MQINCVRDHSLFKFSIHLLKLCYTIPLACLKASRRISAPPFSLLESLNKALWDLLKVQDISPFGKDVHFNTIWWLELGFILFIYFAYNIHHLHMTYILLQYASPIRKILRYDTLFRSITRPTRAKQHLKIYCPLRGRDA